MSKLSYPSDGIYNSTKLYTNACYNQLNKAFSYSKLDIPTDFEYHNYLSTLSSQINSFRNEISDIDNKLRSTTKRFQTLSDNLSEQVNNLDFKDIKIRDRMII